MGRRKIDPGIGATIRLLLVARLAFNISPSLTMLLKAPLLKKVDWKIIPADSRAENPISQRFGFEPQTGRTATACPRGMASLLAER